MSSKGKGLPLYVWAIVVIVLSPVLYWIGLAVAEEAFGGPRTILKGESYGFKIGMKKEEVFATYKSLGEGVNIRCDEPVRALIVDASELEFTPAFQTSNHWQIYRHKYPLCLQDFYFEDNKLVKIVSTIRYSEFP